MMPGGPLRRRTFIGIGLAAASTTSVTSCGRTSSWRFFSQEEARTVDAICEQIIPADLTPGARQAQVVNYIDIQLTRAFKKYQQVYREGIAAVDRASREKFGQCFVKLSADQQVAVLKHVEDKSKTFFTLILTHTRQGFYGDPRHGGNRNMISWKMLGLPFPPLRGRQHYDESKVG